MIGWRTLGLALLIVVATSAEADGRGFPLELDRGESFMEPYTASLSPPGKRAAWRERSFYETVANPDQRLVTVWFRTRFTIAERPAEPLKLYLPRLFHGGRIYLNQTPIGRVPGSTPETQARWLRPHMLDLPVDTLRAGGNELILKVDSRWPTIGIGVPTIGPDTVVGPLYQERHFWEHDVTSMAAIMLLLGGLFLLAVWVRRPSETNYAIFGLAMVAWGLRSAFFLWSLVPFDYWLHIRVIFYALTGLGNILLCIFILRTAGFQRRWLERGALAYAALGPAALLVFGEAFVRWDAAWYLGAMPLNLFATFQLFRAAWHHRTWDLIALAGGIGLAVVAFLHDSMRQAEWITFSGTYLSHIAMPLIMAAMGLILIGRFTDVLRREENISQELAERVRRREQELIASHESLRQMEAERARANERQRVMRDMHDGLGSQLLSSLAMVEAGTADQGQVADVLRECIDDMRLVIDTLSPEDGDLLAALGSLRFRMAPRLRAAGIELAWHLEGEVAAIDVEPGEALAVLRIVQEAISNALKHARANRVDITLGGDGKRFRLRINDDGDGFDPATVAAGRGIGNMRQRAARIGAEFALESSALGTEIRLTIQPNTAPSAELAAIPKAECA